MIKKEWPAPFGRWRLRNGMTATVTGLIHSVLEDNKTSEERYIGFLNISAHDEPVITWRKRDLKETSGDSRYDLMHWERTEQNGQLAESLYQEWFSRQDSEGNSKTS